MHFVYFIPSMLFTPSPRVPGFLHLWDGTVGGLRPCQIGHTFMHVLTKPLVWLRGEVKSPPFSAAARQEAGELLRELQNGEKLSMPHSRPMPSIGPGCHELRVVDEDKTWRIIYRIDRDAILVADVFPKTTQATPVHVIVACKRRLRMYDELTGGN